MKARFLSLVALVLGGLVASSFQGLADYLTFPAVTNAPSGTVIVPTNFYVEPGVAVEAVTVPTVNEADSLYPVVFFQSNPADKAYSLKAGALLLGAIVVGPVRIEMQLLGNSSKKAGWYTFRVTQPSSLSVPSNTVVIPTDAKGPVSIVMESTSDLVNWNKAEPGTYGASNTQRFFRIRAVEQ